MAVMWGRRQETSKSIQMVHWLRSTTLRRAAALGGGGGRPLPYRATLYGAIGAIGAIGEIGELGELGAIGSVAEQSPNLLHGRALR